MDLGTFQKQSRETAIYPHVDGNVFYPILGLVGELDEFVEALEQNAEKQDLLHEAGDVMWHLAQMASECGIDLGEQEQRMIVPPPHNDRGVQLAMARIAQRIAAKLCVRAEKAMLKEGLLPVDPTVLNPDIPVAFKGFAIEAVLVITVHVASVTAGLGTNIYDVLDMNQQKLRDRQARGVLQGSGDHR